MIQQLIDLFLQNPFWQTIWIIAFFISIYNFLYCRDKKFIIFTAIASLFWGVHFLFIWALTAAYINIFDIFKNISALKRERNKKWMWWFLIVYFFIWLYNFFSFDLETFNIWELNYYSLLPTFSALFSTYLVFMTRWIFMKWWFLIVVLAWFIYNIYFGSIGWVMTDIALFIVWIIWIYKDLKSNKK
jgi:hypothetical protein